MSLESFRVLNILRLTLFLSLLFHDLLDLLILEHNFLNGLWTKDMIVKISLGHKELNVWEPAQEILFSNKLFSGKIRVDGLFQNMGLKAKAESV